MLAPIFSSVPAELISLHRWVVWRGNKVPYCASAPNMKASCTDPETWSSFDMVSTTYEEGGFDGIGFALNGDGIVGVDLDKCVNDGVPSPAALVLLDRLGCGYVEFSPSGTGLRGFGYGPKIKGTRGQIDGINVELYSSGRYLTVTGHALKTGALRELSGFNELAESIRGTSRSQTGNPYREDRDDSSHNSVFSVLSVGEAIERTLPTCEGERNDCLFQLARHVKALCPNASENELRQIAMQWHQAALPTIRTKDFLTTWCDFLRGLEKVRYPAGTKLKEIIGEIDMAEPVPDSLVALGYGTKAVHLFRICRRLQECAGDTPFFLSGRQAADLLKIHFTDASKMLAALCMDGVIQEITKGAGSRASRYRFIWSE